MLGRDPTAPVRNLLLLAPSLLSPGCLLGSGSLPSVSGSSLLHWDAFCSRQGGKAPTQPGRYAQGQRFQRPARRRRVLLPPGELDGCFPRMIGSTRHCFVPAPRTLVLSYP